MKKIFLLKFLLLFILINAQTNNLVEYNFIKNDGYKEIDKEYLIFNENELYYANIMNDDNLIYEDEKLDRARLNYDPIYINIKTDSLYQNRIGIFKKNSSDVKRFVLLEKRPVINWKITKESQKILGYTCYKATTKFRGREYIAWFAPEIPYNNGPWKFGGLPGLILKVENDIFNYEAKRIVLNSDKLPNIPSLKALVLIKRKATLIKAIEYENNWLEYNRASIYSTFPQGVRIVEKPLRGDERELSINE